MSIETILSEPLRRPRRKTKQTPTMKQDDVMGLFMQIIGEQLNKALSEAMGKLREEITVNVDHRLEEKTGPDAGDQYVARLVDVATKAIQVRLDQLASQLSHDVSSIKFPDIPPAPEIPKPVRRWKFRVSKLDDGEYEITANAE